MDPKQKQNNMKFAIIHLTILVLNFRDANIHETREKGVPRSTKHREYHLKDEHVLKRAKSSEAPQFSMSGKTSTKSWLHFNKLFPLLSSDIFSSSSPISASQELHHTK